MQEKSKILAVDDNSINLAVIEELLGSQYNLMTVSTGIEALKTAQEFRPDLIILDIMLNGMNGYEVCQELRKSSSLMHTKIIIVSFIITIPTEAKAASNSFRERYKTQSDYVG